VKLNVLKKSQPIQEIDLGKDVFAHDYSETVFLIGRSKDCHVVLDDKKISREHLKVIHKNGKWLVEKMQPENTAEVNGDEFNRHELEESDVITVENFSINVLSLKNATGFTQTKVAAKPADPSSEQINSIAPVPAQAQVAIPVSAPIKKAERTATDVNISAIGTSSNSDATKEIDANELSQLVEESSEFDSQPDELDDLGFDNSTREFQTENSEELVEGISEDENQFTDQPNESIEGQDDGDANYSLANIDSEEPEERTRIMTSFANVHFELFGETAPYDKYILDNDKVYIGRDPSKCQIVLNDSEVSTVHALVTRNNMLITLEDLNSSNGTLYKGDRINKVALSHNDEFVIGGVTFTCKIRSEFLKDESSTLMAVDENQTVEVEEIVEVQVEDGEQLDALGEMVENAPIEKSIIKRVMKDPELRKKVIYGAVLIVGAWFMFGDEEAPKPVVQTKTKKVKTANVSAPIKGGVVLSEDQRRSLSAYYEIGKDHYNNGRYREALTELQKVSAIDPQFNSSLMSLIDLSKQGLAKLEEIEKARIAAEQAAIRKAKIKDLLESARQYTKDRQLELAQSTFNEITQLDPENLEVSKLKRELENWQKDKERAEQEVIEKKKAREAKIEKLKPSKTLFLQKEWFRAISKLEEFLKIKDMDEDLTTEATEMLKTSREELSTAVAPLVGKAKSLMEGQDLKGAYEVYQQILRVEPSNNEALNQMGDIKEQLVNRARKIYREAIIAESLSLFQDAKEKFQEVQQISPVDSEYYKKASDKLREYLD
jgi:pSer/pThr/pTyr-binding forkhead associated (FHA) protein